jgi:hypothetical protein
VTRAFSTVVMLAWAVWFGGMIFLFVALASIFGTPDFDRETAGRFAAGLFPKFERMQLVCAGVALAGTFGWWLASRGRAKLVLFALFAAATLAAVAEAALVTPRVEALRLAGRRGTPQFERAHQLSSRVYLSGAAVLLAAGLVLPAAVRSDAASRRRPTRAPDDAAGAGAPLAAARD